MLALEALLGWHIVRWGGWAERFRSFWRGDAGNGAYARSQAKKPVLARSVRYSDSGLEFVPVIVIGVLVPVFIKLLPLVMTVAAQHQAALAKLLDITVLLLGVLLMVGLPVLNDDVRTQLVRKRKQKREDLMRTLAPSEWVCPNCLATLSAPL